MNELQVFDRSGKPALGLELPKGMAFDDWVSLGKHLCAGAQVINWHIGDWWAFGDHRYGARAQAAAEGIFGREFQTLRNAGSVCRAFETSRRRDIVSWSHHVEVSPLTPADADALLDRAAQENWSVRQLRRAVAAIREQQINRRRVPDVIDVRPHQDEPQEIGEITMVEMVIELAEALGRERGLSERESMFLETALRYIRRKDPRRLAPWTGEDEMELVRMLREGMRPKQIAPVIDRTIGAVWRQIGKLGGIQRIVGEQRTRPVGRLGLA